MEEKTEEPVIRLDSVDKYNKLYGFETRHPLVAVVDLRKATTSVNHVRFNYGLYALWLKHGQQCSIRYGRQNYDYQEGTIVSFAPGQAVEVLMAENVEQADAVGLLFHPDIIHGTVLGKCIDDYHFFDYDSAEALHLSVREQQVIVDVLGSINSELEMPVDRHSQTILVDRIKLVLDYCQRFYDRQFITRHKVNSDVLTAFEQNLKEYFNSGEAERSGLPTVAYFADKAFLTPGYFGDLIKKETGLTAQQLIQNKLVVLSKQFLLDSRYTINQVSAYLGFLYPQHFSRFFKTHVGMSPKEYKDS